MLDGVGDRRQGITVRDGLQVTAGLKIGDVDPRDDRRACFLVSDMVSGLLGRSEGHNAAAIRSELQESMFTTCGVYRTEELLTDARDVIAGLRERARHLRVDDRGCRYNTDLGEALERRVRPLAESVNATFIEPCNVSSDTEIEALRAKTRDQTALIARLQSLVARAGPAAEATDAGPTGDNVITDYRRVASELRVAENNTPKTPTDTAAKIASRRERVARPFRTGDVGVGVDQPGQEGGVAEVNDAGPLGDGDAGADAGAATGRRDGLRGRRG